MGELIDWLTGNRSRRRLNMVEGSLSDNLSLSKTRWGMELEAWFSVTACWAAAQSSLYDFKIKNRPSVLFASPTTSTWWLKRENLMNTEITAINNRAPNILRPMFRPDLSVCSIATVHKNPSSIRGSHVSGTQKKARLRSRRYFIRGWGE